MSHQTDPLSGRSQQMEPSERRQRRLIVGASLALFVVGAALPALTFIAVAGDEIGQSQTYPGFLCLLLGPILVGLILHVGLNGNSMLGIAWLANIFVAWALWSVWRGWQTRRIELLSATAVVLALLPLLAFVVPTAVYACCETTYESRLTAIGFGYLAWILSALSALVGAIAIDSSRRARAAGPGGRSFE